MEQEMVTLFVLAVTVAAASWLAALAVFPKRWK